MLWSPCSRSSSHFDSEANAHCSGGIYLYHAQPSHDLVAISQQVIILCIFNNHRNFACVCDQLKNGCRIRSMIRGRITSNFTVIWSFYDAEVPAALDHPCGASIYVPCFRAATAGVRARWSATPSTPDRPQERRLHLTPR
jgi:hypothetical protein